jgi:hypothetical protein
LAIVVSGAWLSVIMTLETIGAFTNASLETPVSHAEIDMTWGLVLIWVVGGGSLTLLLRGRVSKALSRLPGDPRLKFFLFAAGLSMIEEAVTTGMTNLAPEFGVRIGQAYITASANYFDVILFHSVIVFLPMFAAWALLLSRYSFDPKAVLLLYGITGAFSETISFGFANLIGAGLWILVYGLMVYLPAFAVSPVAGVRPPRARHYLLALVLPIICAIPVAVAILLVFHQPTTDFQDVVLAIPLQRTLPII